MFIGALLRDLSASIFSEMFFLKRHISTVRFTTSFFRIESTQSCINKPNRLLYNPSPSTVFTSLAWFNLSLISFLSASAFDFISSMMIIASASCDSLYDGGTSFVVTATSSGYFSAISPPLLLLLRINLLNICNSSLIAIRLLSLHFIDTSFPVFSHSRLLWNLDQNKHPLLRALAGTDTLAAILNLP